jgi:hypothetical protein
VTNVFDAELARYDWPALACGCGRNAAHIPSAFRAILTFDEAAGGPSLTDHIEVEGSLFQAAVPAVSVILAALASPITAYARDQFIDSLWYVAHGEPDPTEAAQGRADLVEACRERMREGIWIIYREAFSKRRAETAMDILEMVDDDRQRFEEYRARLGR